MRLRTLRTEYSTLAMLRRRTANEIPPHIQRASPKSLNTLLRASSHVLPLWGAFNSENIFHQREGRGGREFVTSNKPMPPDSPQAEVNLLRKKGPNVTRNTTIGSR